MTFQRLLAGALALACATPALADIVLHDPYARTSRPGAPSGAAFMMLENTGTADDRLVAASSDIADRVELHTHIDDGNGVMQMREIEGGIALPAGASHMMKRGGDHVMFLGLKTDLAQGDTVTVTLSFQEAGDVVVEIPVDLERMPDHGGMDHGAMSSDK
ncbi:copper chaperone PCu(A)C [Thalassococcus sp. BH17M4-6]|uniref:copper chaperone PCu(A)C n=1 Tax=Thalassococcus sp. BH17M4-6 TaxID=3413148 RepID=UPI003BBE33BA